MFSTESFRHLSLIGLSLVAARVARGIMHGDVSVMPLEDPDHYFGGAHPERGYVLECRGENIADVLERDGRHWASWNVQYDPEGAAAFESRLIAEADAAHAVARAVRSIEDDGGFIDGAGENVASRAPGSDPVAWFDYEDADGRRDRIYFHGAAEACACMRWARAHDLA